MPQFHISSVPSQVSQMITQASLIQNLSTTETIYLDIESSVSPGAFGVALGPRSAMTWQSDTPLWAVTADGDGADLSVMYGADSAALGEVTVIGEVTVEGDVTVSGTVDASGSVVTLGAPVTINGPVDVSGSDVSVTGPVTITGTVNVGNVVQTQTEVTNTVTTNVSNTVTTEVTGTVDTLITAPVEITGPVDVSGSNVAVTGSVGISGPVTIDGTVPVSGDVNIDGPVNIGTVASTVNIDGTVDIDLPVNVQGGGAVILNNIFPVPDTTGTYYNLPITEPPSGLTYYGLRFDLYVLADEELIGYRVDYGLGGEIETLGTIGYPFYGAAATGYLGDPRRHSFTIPMTGDYPLTLRLQNLSGSTVSVRVTVRGISNAPLYPTTDYTRNWSDVGGAVVPFIDGWGWPQNGRIYLPASFETQRVRMYASSSSTLNALRLFQLFPDGSTQQLQDQMQTWDIGAPRPMDPNSAIIMDIPGTGSTTFLSSAASGNTPSFGLGLLGTK